MMRRLGLVSGIVLALWLTACSQYPARPQIVPAEQRSPIENDAPPVLSPAQTPREVPTHYHEPEGKNAPQRQPEGSVSGASVGSTPPVVHTLIEKASASLYLGKIKEAERYLDQAQRIAPKEAQVYLFYGDYYLEQQRNDDAFSMYKRALSLAEPGSRVAEQATFRLNKLSP